MDQELQTLLEPHSESVRELVLALQALVQQVMPDAEPRVDLGHRVINFGTGDGMKGRICYIAPFKKHANLGFMQGASLGDPEGLLEGTGKNLRHVKIRARDQVEEPALRALLEEAAS